MSLKLLLSLDVYYQRAPFWNFKRLCIERSEEDMDLFTSARQLEKFGVFDAQKNNIGSCFGCFAKKNVVEHNGAVYIARTSKSEVGLLCKSDDGLYVKPISQKECFPHYLFVREMLRRFSSSSSCE